MHYIISVSWLGSFQARTHNTHISLIPLLGIAELWALGSQTENTHTCKIFTLIKYCAHVPYATRQFSPLAQYLVIRTIAHSRCWVSIEKEPDMKWHFHILNSKLKLFVTLFLFITIEVVYFRNNELIFIFFDTNKTRAHALTLDPFPNVNAIELEVMKTHHHITVCLYIVH